MRSKCEPPKILLGKNQTPKNSTSQDVEHKIYITEQEKLQRSTKIVNPHKILSSQISYPNKDLCTSPSLFYVINYPSH